MAKSDIWGRKPQNDRHKILHAGAVHYVITHACFVKISKRVLVWRRVEFRFF